MAATLVPLTKALEQVQNSSNKEMKQNMGDASKLLTNSIYKNIQTHREIILNNLYNSTPKIQKCHSKSSIFS
jgi:iron-sulfur cluster repair protein YtfE (RIC family)